MKYCHSCGMPLTAEMETTARGDFCRYCSEESGELKPRAEVEAGIAQWLASWGPAASEAEYAKRAKAYLGAMPAWAS